MDINIKHLAKLSRISVSSEDEERFEQQIKDIVGMVEKLPALSDDKSLLDKSNVMQLREDVVENHFKRDEILKNAPQVKAGCVVVPKVIE